MWTKPAAAFALVLRLAAAAPSAISETAHDGLESRSSPASEFVTWSKAGCVETPTHKSITDGGCYNLPGQSISILSLSPGCAVRTWESDSCSGAWSQHVTLGACFDISSMYGVSIVC